MPIDLDDRYKSRRITSPGSHFLAGAVALIEEYPDALRPYRLTPSLARTILTQKGWNRVVGFHSRNVAHQVHVHLQRTALDLVDADGLLISPVLGLKKPGDFLSEPIIESYQALLRTDTYPPNRVLFGGFSSYPRYAGPREAVFTALCRKNLGCSHFIVGRDHTSVAEFYGDDAARGLFDALPDIGVAPVFFEAIAYDSKDGLYKPSSEADTPEEISGQAARAALLAGERLPDWFMHPAVQDSLAERLAAGRPLFHHAS